MAKETANLTLFSKPSDSDSRKFYPDLQYKGNTVGRQTMVETKALEGKHSQSNATTQVTISYKTADFRSVVASVGTDTGNSSVDVDTTTITFDLSEPPGTLAEDFGFTVQLTLTAESIDGTVGDWTRNNDQWFLDPFVRIKRSSYSVRAG
ncbi:MAG: hypothetical protein ACE37F_33240 [Nannocystaceae bacterium]|nr:hypothetical protein [bacterium]